MTPYIKMAEHLLIDRVVSKKFPITGKSKASFGLLALSGFFFVVGAGFFIHAAHIWFGNTYPPEIAAAYTGLLCMGLCAIAAGAMLVIIKQSRRKVEQSTKEAIHQVQGLINAANDEFGEPIQENPKTAVALATALGMAVGNKLF